VDRLKEALADAAEIRNGLRSYPDVLASRGESWREVLDEAMAWLAELDTRKLSFDCDPRHANGAAPTLGADSGYLDPATDPAPADAPKPAEPPPADVARMLDVVQELTEGSITEQTARSLLVVGFPQMTSEQIDALLASVPRSE
jgi:hypothetical protein